MACRRLTPGPGYLEALCEDHVCILLRRSRYPLTVPQVDFISAHIKCITPTGIETIDGKHEEFDIIVCATGTRVQRAASIEASLFVL